MIVSIFLYQSYIIYKTFYEKKYKKGEKKQINWEFISFLVFSALIFLLPVFLFSGSLFPTEILPSWANVIVKFSPLWHAIELIRNLCVGEFHLSLLVHVLFFLVLITFGLFILTRRLNNLFMK